MIGYYEILWSLRQTMLIKVLKIEKGFLHHSRACNSVFVPYADLVVLLYGLRKMQAGGLKDL